MQEYDVQEWPQSSQQEASWISKACRWLLHDQSQRAIYLDDKGEICV